MKNKIKITLTGGDVVKFRELSLEEYLNLQKTCIEEDIEVFKDFITVLLDDVVDELPKNMTVIDLYHICLELIKTSITDEKRFSIRKDGEYMSCGFPVDKFLQPVLERYAQIVGNMPVVIPIEDYIISEITYNPFVMGLNVVGFKKDGVYQENTSPQLQDYFPVHVSNKISEVYNNYDEIFKDIHFFQTETDSGSKVNVGFSIDVDCIYGLLKILFKQDLKGLYKNIYDAKRRMNINFNEHKHITYREFELYISMYNKEVQDEQDRANKQDQSPTLGGLPQG